MGRIPFFTSVALAGSLLASESPAFGQRSETVSPAQLVATEKCPLTPATALDRDRERSREAIGPILATLFAGLAGDLVKSGVNAVGNALEAASREHGFVAEGSTGFNYGAIERTSGPASFQPKESCLILYVPSDAGDIQDIFSDITLTRDGALTYDWSTSESQQVQIGNTLRDLGLNRMPRLYAEVTLLPGPEGVIARPSLIWYREALQGAPRRATSAELHLLLATPGYDAKELGIGNAFAGERVKLPALVPGRVLDWNQLLASRSVWLPNRPTAGGVDARVQAINSAITLVATRTAELRKAERAFEAAERAAQTKPGPEATEAVVVAAANRDDASKALLAATNAVPSAESKPAGATNAQMRLVIVRDANKFGMALANALKSQAEAAGKATTEALAPAADWSTQETAYLTAALDVQTKQAAYDNAIAAGDTAAIAKTGGDLAIAKAKANEAAVASNRPIPYPGLLDGL